MLLTDTLDQINALSNERQRFWRQASKSALSSAQCDRLHQIAGQLEMLWQKRRFELAEPLRKAKPPRVPRNTALSIDDMVSILREEYQSLKRSGQLPIVNALHMPERKRLERVVESELYQIRKERQDVQRRINQHNMPLRQLREMQQARREVRLSAGLQSG